MAIIDKLATSLNRRDEVPNQQLAQQIAAKNDHKAVAELFENLNHKNKAIQSDCIKVIYETGMLKPALISGYSKELISLLDSKNNRLQWGAMTALDSITGKVPQIIFRSLAKLAAVAEKGSVITHDHYMGILTKLCAMKAYAGSAFTLLNERLRACPTNQLPMYAENALPVITGKTRETFIKTLRLRIPEIEKETKRSRVEKVVKKLLT